MSTPTATAQKSRARRIVGHPLMHLLAAVIVLALLQTFVVKLFAVPSGSMEQTLEVGDRILVNRLADDPQPGDVVVFRTDEALWPSHSAPQQEGLWGAAKHAAKWFFGDILGFGPTTAHTMVKRVIGVEGQTVACCGENGGVLVDGIERVEPYIYEDLPFATGSLDCESTPISTRCFAPIRVPEGMLLMLGDHRGASSDGVSHCRGSTDESSASGLAAGSSCARFVRVDDVYGEVLIRVWPFSAFGALETSR